MQTALHKIEKRLREHRADHAIPTPTRQRWLSRLLGRQRKPIEYQLIFNPPAQPNQLTQFEQRYSVALPNDVVQSYLYMNGTEEYTDLDAAWMRFLPIQEWRPYLEEFPNDRASQEEPFSSSFVFADHGISAWFFAIDLEPARHGFIYSLTHSPHRVADSFSDFVELVLERPEELFR